jgi:GNAT superfamily N-acetyltransferase
MMRLLDKEGRTIIVSEYGPADLLSLFLFYQHLSAESRSRFAPHPFDYNALQEMSKAADPAYRRFIAREEGADPLIGYFLFYQGIFEWEQHRFNSYGAHWPAATTCTFAPAVADRWQGCGLGKLIYVRLENLLKNEGNTHLVLWGGVQAGNEKARRFYQSLGYQPIGQFRFQGMENIDMVKELR